MNTKHWWIMLLCCLIPIVAIVAVSVLGIPLSTVALFGLLLLCPLGHFFMMRGMGHEAGHQHGSEAMAAVQPLDEDGKAPKASA